MHARVHLCMYVCMRACMHAHDTWAHACAHAQCTCTVAGVRCTCAAHPHALCRTTAEDTRKHLAMSRGGGCQCKIAKAADEPIGYPIHCRTDCKCTTSAKAKRRGASAEWECRLQDQSPECKRESARCKMQVPAVRQRESERCKTKVKGEGGSCRPARLQIPVLPEADTSPWCKLI